MKVMLYASPLQEDCVACTRDVRRFQPAATVCLFRYSQAETIESLNIHLPPISLHLGLLLLMRIIQEFRLQRREEGGQYFLNLFIFFSERKCSSVFVYFLALQQAGSISSVLSHLVLLTPKVVEERKMALVC